MSHFILYGNDGPITLPKSIALQCKYIENYMNNGKNPDHHIPIAFVNGKGNMERIAEWLRHQENNHMPWISYPIQSQTLKDVFPSHATWYVDFFDRLKSKGIEMVTQCLLAARDLGIPELERGCVITLASMLVSKDLDSLCDLLHRDRPRRDVPFE